MKLNSGALATIWNLKIFNDFERIFISAMHVEFDPKRKFNRGDSQNNNETQVLCSIAIAFFCKWYSDDQQLYRRQLYIDMAKTNF